MADLVIVLAAALMGGLLTHHLRQPILLGYLLGGIAIGPFALGWVQDVEAVEALASALITILITPMVMNLAFALYARLERIEGLAPLLTASGQSILKEREIDLSNCPQHQSQSGYSGQGAPGLGGGASWAAEHLGAGEARV